MPEFNVWLARTLDANGLPVGVFEEKSVAGRFQLYLADAGYLGYDSYTASIFPGLTIFVTKANLLCLLISHN